MGFVVPSLEEAMEEFGRVLQVEWRPVQGGELLLTDPSGQSGTVDIEYTYSAGGPPAIELFVGTSKTVLGDVLSVGSVPQFHHLGFWVGDLHGETDRVRSEGWPMAGGVSPMGGAPARNILHHSPFGYIELNHLYTNREWIRDLFPPGFDPDG